MPASKNVNIQPLLDEVTRAKTLKDSVVTLLNGITAKIQAAVTEALTADNAADDTSIQAANDAIASAVSDLTSSDDAIAAAVAAGTPAAPANPAPGTTGTDPTV